MQLTHARAASSARMQVHSRLEAVLGAIADVEALEAMTRRAERAALLAGCTVGWLRTRRLEQSEEEDEEEDEEGDEDAAVVDSLSSTAASPRSLDHHRVRGRRRSVPKTAAEEWADSLSAAARPLRADASADTSADESATINAVVVSHAYLACMALVLLHHMTRTREACARCGLGMGTAELFGEMLAMPAFAVRRTALPLTPAPLPPSPTAPQPSP